MKREPREDRRARLSTNRAVIALLALAAALVASPAPAYTSVSGSVSGEWAAGTYLVTGPLTVDDRTTLVLDAGVVVKFDLGQRLEVDGTIDVNGTAASPVVFTSKDDDTYGEILPSSDGVPSPGDWDVIVISDFLGTDGVGDFEHCIVRYGGEDTGGQNANIIFTTQSPGRWVSCRSEFSGKFGAYFLGNKTEVRGSTFADNTRDGAWILVATPDMVDNAFDRNGGCGIHASGIELGSFSGNTGEGNAVNGLCVSGSIYHDQTWSGTSGFPLVITSRLDVSLGTTLRISEGTILKGDNIFAGMVVDGTLEMIGSASRPVVMTSINDDTYGGDTNGDGDTVPPAPGDWWGLWLSGTDRLEGIGIFEHAILRYGGYASGLPGANVAFSQSDAGSFVDSNSELSGSAGIVVLGASPEVRGSQIRDNASYGVRIADGGRPDLGGQDSADWGFNTFLANDGGQYQVANETANTIQAYGNQWGYDTAAAIDAHLLDDDEDSARGAILFDPWGVQTVPGIPVASPIALTLFAALIAAAGGLVLRAGS